MEEIKQFVYNYQNMTKEEKKKVIKESSIEFLTAACCFGKMLGIDITSEVKSLQDENRILVESAKIYRKTNNLV